MVPIEVNWALPVMLDNVYFHLFASRSVYRSMPFWLKDLLLRALPGPMRIFPVYFRPRRLSVLVREGCPCGCALCGNEPLIRGLTNRLGS